MPTHDQFRAQLLETFRIEAGEHLGAISAGLVEMEQTTDDARRRAVLETVFRGAHSLKGAARSVDMSQIERLCQAMESVFAAVKRAETHLTPSGFTVLHRMADAILALTAEPDGLPEGQVTLLVNQLRALTLERQPQASPVPSPPVSATPGPETTNTLTGTVRVETDRLDTVLLQAEELLGAKLAAIQRAEELGQVRTRVRQLEKAWAAIGPELRKAGPELRNQLKALSGEVAALSDSADGDARTLTVMVDTLLEETRKLLMLPCASLLQSFPKMVRDLAHDLGKEVDLVMRGTEVELDKRILEQLKDPLVHLIRNCVDHGIEPPAVRLRASKSRRGTITVTVARLDSNRVEVTIADDGPGIDPDRVREAARTRGHLAAEQVGQMSDPEVIALIFQSGISTSNIISDISGRGLGLAIVREHVEDLGGLISVQTLRGAGTTFRMVLPVAYSTFRGISVRAAGLTVIVPTTHVNRVLRLHRSAVMTALNQETFSLDGAAISLVHLGDVLQRRREPDDRPGDFMQVIVLETAAAKIAFRVDQVQGEQEVLVKRLGKQLSRVRNIAGAVVLGSGEVVPVLNVRDLMRSAVKVKALPGPADAGEPVRGRRILVVEDSITARMLLKNILESAGYTVSIAVDGIDALATLKTSEIDLVVSDIDMPRMDGFQLTEQIRAGDTFSALPVVLVTSLESREHRERGIDAGANAYIVKSSFDQGNLLDTIRRLL